MLPWLIKRRSKFYEGTALKESIDSFLKIVDNGAEIYETKDAVIVLEPFGLSGNFRAWLLFDSFNRGVIKAMETVTNNFKGTALYASTHDERIKKILVKLGYIQYKQDEHDYWLVKRGK